MCLVMTQIKTLINGKIEAKKMDVERLRLSQRERSKWSKIGKSFGCTSAEALSWFCAGAPIILLDGVDGGKTPYANKAELEHWLKKRFRVLGIKNVCQFSTLLVQRTNYSVFTLRVPFKQLI